MPKKEETNDIIQYLIPQLEALDIKKNQCKVDVTTEKSGQKRGDIWISKTEQKSKSLKAFEKDIICLIEAKHKKCMIGDLDWRNAMKQGREKAIKQKLNYYVVSNCLDSHRYYNAFNDEEIFLDGKTLTQLQKQSILELIQTQVNKDNSYVIFKASILTVPMSESRFRGSLKNLADIYRSCGVKGGDDRIDPTVSFVVFKYIGELESAHRTLPKQVKIWSEYGKPKGDFVGDFKTAKQHIFDDPGSPYYDFKDLIQLPQKVNDENYEKIYDEIDQYTFHGCAFDVFGAIYEEYASQTKKKEFGEFYTRRHITGIVSRLLLHNEISGRDIKICDPACGSGGFLTEAYKTLLNNYTSHGKMNKRVETQLAKETFYGYDNDPKSVARSKLNMFLVGDGHTHIKDIDDSLNGWKVDISWKENEFDYILANPPMGSYSGSADISDFTYTNEKRLELLFVERMVSALKPGGEIAVVVNDGALEAPSREKWRINLLNNCYIHAIISLPKFEFAPYTKEKTYVLFMQKKQKEDIGNIQKFPIWHYIIDYDGYANSDKRFKTKYHDDLPELEQLYINAINLSKLSIKSKTGFDTNRIEYERKVNEREIEEGISGYKYAYTEMGVINKDNFYNLICEFHLRPIVVNQINESQLDDAIKKVSKMLRDVRTI